MAANPMRIGVLGAGWFASRRHCPDVVDHDEAKLTALCRRSADELQRMGQAFGVDALFADYREMIVEADLDGVIICSPHNLHYEHAFACLQADLHVLLEKPISVESGQGRKLVAEAAERDRVLLVAQNPPYWNHCRRLREAIDSDELGELESATITWVGNALGVLGREELSDDIPGVVKPTLFRQSPTANGGGFLVDGGSHLITELIWCTRRRITEVAAIMDNVNHDVRAALTLRLDNGATATLSNTADSVRRDKRQRSIYCGSMGTAWVRGFPFHLDLDSGGQVHCWSDEELPTPPSPVDDFIACISEQREPQITGAEAVHVVEVLEAAYASARERRTVTVGQTDTTSSSSNAISS